MSGALKPRGDGRAGRLASDAFFEFSER